MLWDQIEQLRYAVESPLWPLPCNRWPEDLLKETNCLAFALGLNLGSKDYDHLVSLNPEIPQPKFSSVFEKLLDELGLEWRKIANANEALGNEYILQIYGFYCMPPNYHPDFHVIRRELDGTWVHKPDFLEFPMPIYWKEFIKEYPDTDISGKYAVKKKAH